MKAAGVDRTPFTEAVNRSRSPLMWAGGFSLLANVLTLTSTLYIMQVFDRVLSSGSVWTLFYLTTHCRR